VNVFALLFVVLGLGLIGWLTARARAVGFDRGGQKRLHSLPSQHGWYVAMWTVLPALLFIALWSSLSPALIKDQVLKAPAAAQLSDFDFERDTILGEARDAALGRTEMTFDPTAEALVEPMRDAIAFYGWTGTGDRDPARLCRRRLRLHPDQPGLPRTHPGGARADADPAARLADRDPDDGGHLPVAVLGIAALLRSKCRSPDFLFGTHWSPQVIDAEPIQASRWARCRCSGVPSSSAR
jgi:phosphate transport system permease protein